MKRQIFTLIIFICIYVSGISVSALAEENLRNDTYLNISATERTEVEGDLLVAKLRFEFEGKEAKHVQNKINDAVAEALNKAKALQKSDTHTEQYSVYKHREGEPKRIIWRGSQAISITGKHSDEILQLVGELQNMGFAVTSLNYIVSPKKHEEVRDSLMELAIEKLMKKAQRVAKSIGANDIKIININVDGDNQISPMHQDRMITMRAKGQEYTTPVASPQQNQIYMKVSAKILIKN